MRLFPLSILPFLMFACDGGTDTDLDPDSELGTEDNGTEEPGTQLTGVIRDEEGAGLGGVRVNLCRNTCTTAQTEADGSYLMPGLAPNRYSLHVETLGSVVLSDPAVPFDLVEGETVTLDALVPKAIAVAIPTASTELEAAGDLLLTMQAGQLTILFEDDPTEISAVRVAEADALPVDLTGDIAAIWYMEPWSGEADPAIPLRIRDDFGADGDTYELFQSNYDDSDWESLGTMTSADGMIAGNISLSRFDTLVLIATP